jgi:peptidyl-prolyl cis-trans isomerase D
MLQSIRERFTGPIAFVIIAVIGITLVISFGNMDTSGVSGNAAAEVNGEEIALADYQRVMRNQLVRQQERFQGELPAALQDQLARNVLESLVRNQVVTQYVSDVGYRVSEEDVRTYIRMQPVFQVGGEFSYESYIAILSSQGFSPEQFERKQARQLEVNQADSGIVASAFYTPGEFRHYIELLAEQRAAAYVSFDPVSIASEVKVDATALQEYYDANPAQFETEELVTLEYVEMRLADVSESIVVEEAAIREYYEANPELYRTDEQRQARHILIAVGEDTDEAAAEQKAVDLRRRLADGEDFAKLAEEFSDDTVSGKEGGSLGWAGPGDFVPAFEEVFFALEKGEISDPVRSEFGYHVILLEDIQPGSQRTYAEVREELLAGLQEREAMEHFYALAEQVDDLALQSPDLETVAREAGLELKRVENFTRAGAPPFGYDSSLVDAAFSFALLEDGENSPVLQLADDHAVVIRVAEHFPARLQEIDEVRDSLEEIVRLELAAETARVRGQEVLARLEDGESIDSLATEYGFEVVKLEAMKRGADTVDAELSVAIFRAPKPAENQPMYHGTSLGNGGYAVFRVDAVRAGRPEEIPQQQRDERKQAMAQQLGAADAAAMVSDLRDEANVYVTPGLFDSPDI